MFKKLVLKFLSPIQLWKAYRVSKNRKKITRATEDPQLKLYDKILKTDFLHYGFFEDPEKDPSEISLNDIRRAQIKYAELILDQIRDKKGPVLDIGCGMGGLIAMLLKENMPVVGITPDRVQVEYITRKYPKAKLIKYKFQKMPVDTYKNYFTTIIHSESLQYMRLDKSIENVLSILKSGGRWIVIDYFRTGEAVEKSGHYWEDFLQRLDENNLEVIYNLDITENIKPTLDYIYMWGNEIGKPIFEFLVAKLERKHPAKHYLLQDMIMTLTKKIDKNLLTVHPDTFVKNKKYVLLAIELRKN